MYSFKTQITQFSLRNSIWSYLLRSSEFDISSAQGHGFMFSLDVWGGQTILYMRICIESIHTPALLRCLYNSIKSRLGLIVALLVCLCSCQVTYKLHPFDGKTWKQQIQLQLLLNSPPDNQAKIKPEILTVLYFNDSLSWCPTVGRSSLSVLFQQKQHNYHACSEYDHIQPDTIACISRHQFRTPVSVYERNRSWRSFKNVS